MSEKALILVVDDDDEFRAGYMRMLEASGHEPVGAGSVAAARKFVEDRVPDLILMDARLPDGNGILLCKELKERPELRSTIIVIVSGLHVGPEDIAQSLESGADGYMVKPVPQRVLVSQVKALLRLKQAEKDLRQANHQLLEFNRLKAEFVANMSHELRTPLTAVIGFAQLLLMHRDREPLSATQQDKIERILRNGRHLLTLVDDVLDLSKIEAGRMAFHPEPFEVASLVEDCFAELQALAEQKKLNYSLEVVGSIPLAFSDELRIRQIVINLLSNAIKFTQTGGVSVRVFQDGPLHWVCEVKDSGIGIQTDDLTMIFERFRQVDGSSTRKAGGTGLGLSIAQQVANLLGGRIEVDSEFGKGSCFRVRLPLAAPQVNDRFGLRTNGHSPAESMPVSRVDEAAKGSGPLVLVIEDDPDSRSLLESTLTESGFQVQVAENGQDGIAMARELLPSSITLDIMMSSVDGWRVLQALRADPTTAGIPVIICSIVDNRALGYRLGASDYLIKPIDPQKLVRSLQLVGAGESDEGEYVLVVDDEPQVRELLCSALRETGFRSRAVPSGEVALAIVSDRAPMAVLCDLMMPGGMSGYEFIARLRSNSATASIPVVVITGKDLSDEDRVFLRGQIAEVVRKGDLLLHDLQSRLKDTLLEIGVAP